VAGFALWLRLDRLRERGTMNHPSPQAVAVRVWDLPTRLFHWLLVLAVIVSVSTAHIGGNAMVWHFRSGYTIFTLLAFRLLWGFFGGRWSRFSSFVFRPATTLRYLRGRTHADERLDVGHNPLGSLSVFALLGLLIVQVGTGLIADDQIANAGPLNRFVSNATAGQATHWHKDYAEWVLLALVLLHIGAIAYYLLRKRRNLLRPMIDGDKPLPADTPHSNDGLGKRGLALIVLLLCAAAVREVVRLGG
jgi:cytochrome b